MKLPPSLMLPGVATRTRVFYRCTFRCRRALVDWCYLQSRFWSFQSHQRAPEGRGAGAGASCRSAELATIKAGRSVKTSPVLPSRAKALLKRFFWGTLNVVKWSPPQLGHSKRPSLTTKAKQTPSPLPRPCQFSSNPLGLDPVIRYPTTQGTRIKRPLHPYFPLWLQHFNCALINGDGVSHTWVNS